MEFVKKPLLCDEDVMHTNNIITYGFLAQKSLREYSNIVNSKQGDFKSRRSGNGSGSGRGSSARSDITCYKCDKRSTPRKTAGQRDMVLVVTQPRSQ